MPTQLFERSRKGEHALLVQPHRGGPPDEGALEEFAELARSAGASVAHVMAARIDRPNPATLIGSGKLEEVKAAAEASGADLVLVNHALSPLQERNLEKALERRVVDRTGLILDIFAQRAASHEGKLQVELAQLKHMATRLVRAWYAAGRIWNASAAVPSACAAPAKPSSKPTAACCRSASRFCKSAWKRSRCGAPRCAARGCAASFRGWRWWATPMPANPPCSTP